MKRSKAPKPLDLQFSNLDDVQSEDDNEADDESETPIINPGRRTTVQFSKQVYQLGSPAPTSASDLDLLSPAAADSSDSSSPKTPQTPSGVTGFGKRGKKGKKTGVLKSSGAEKFKFSSNGVPLASPTSKTSKTKEEIMPPIVTAKRHGVQWREKAGSLADDKKANGAAPAPYVPPARRQRGSEVITPTVNGMRVFGLGKLGIARAVVKFSGPPQPQPLTLCFHFPSTFLTHRYVLDMVRTKIHFVGGATVKTVQFIDRNVTHGTQSMDNRWLVTVSSIEARDEILRLGLHLYNRRINVRRYDDILAEEYKEYMQYQELQKRLYAKMEAMQKMIAEAEGKVPVDADEEIVKAIKELNRGIGAKTRATTPASASLGAKTPAE